MHTVDYLNFDHIITNYLISFENNAFDNGLISVAFSVNDLHGSFLCHS